MYRAAHDLWSSSAVIGVRRPIIAKCSPVAALLYAACCAGQAQITVSQPPNTSPPHARGSLCVLIAADDARDGYRECVESIRASTPPAVEIRVTSPSTAAVNAELALLADADVAIVTEPCLVSDGWLERLRDAARADSNTATASALADRGTALALYDERVPGPSPTDSAEAVARRSARARPLLTRAVGPCVCLRRDALELVGPLDEQLDLRWALEVDLTQRCVLSGLTHVAADDVLVTLAAQPAPGATDELPATLAARYPYLVGGLALGDSDVLTHALTTARGQRERLWVTIDARALDGAITGTHVNIVELIVALARTGALRLRVLVRERRIDRATLSLLEGLPDTEILAFERVDASTPASTVFHRPQQTFTAGDVALATQLGERFVLSQLDLIAYRNPGYFADADAWQDYRRASRHGLSAAERVVVFSEHTRRELLADALVADDRIGVVAPGIDHRVSGQQRRPAALSPDEHGYLLCLGTDFRHKNRVFAMRLLASLRGRHDWRGRLVLAGTHIERGSSRELEREFMSEHSQLEQSIVSLGPVSEPERAWLVANAAAIVYPSAYEGFGLVPFESALAGVPCVFAAQSSLAEVAPAGTAAILPWDADASADATHELLSDDAARAEHVRMLAASASELTWTTCAAEMTSLYHEAASAPVRDAATLSRDLVVRERRLSVEHEVEVAQLLSEREHAKRMYDDLNREVGTGLSLIGPNGALPDGLQRALLAIAARPAMARPLFGALAGCYRLARAAGRLLR
jgi:glycosyltransferase involved in cell wall biosynthesis